MGPLADGRSCVSKTVNLNANRYIYQKTGDPRFRPNRLLESAVKENRLGAVTGEGYYTYTKSAEELYDYRDRAIGEILQYLEQRTDEAGWVDAEAR